VGKRSKSGGSPTVAGGIKPLRSNGKLPVYKTRSPANSWLAGLLAGLVGQLVRMVDKARNSHTLSHTHTLIHEKVSTYNYLSHAFAYLKSVGPQGPCRFESDRPHQQKELGKVSPEADSGRATVALWRSR
jgi:hypothetical protein